MKTYWIDRKFKYDGTQLRSLFAYLNYHVLGDSCISWVGPCEVHFDHMVDGEDLIAKSQIASDRMVHFIIEVFDKNLFSGVLLQRLFAGIVKDLLSKKISENEVSELYRSGDDVYIGDRKFSISIATDSPKSIMIHFAINVVNEGTPVKTACLDEFQIPYEEFAKECMDLFCKEYLSIVDATFKVKSVP